jgi:hypothetical protein
MLHHSDIDVIINSGFTYISTLTVQVFIISRRLTLHRRFVFLVHGYQDPSFGVERVTAMKIWCGGQAGRSGATGESGKLR